MSDLDQTSHDQNFKNLILDFVLQSLRFFGGAEGEDIPDDAVITPLRQEQLKPRLTDGHREVDLSFLAEFPSGDRKAIVYLIEEETEPRHFSIHRLAHYMLDVAELNDTDRVVPIVIFLRKGDAPNSLQLGSERASYLSCTYVACHLARMNALDHLDSPNIVARILLPCMGSPSDRRVEIVARALEGVITLEANVHKQRKYTEFVTTYAGLKREERVELEQVLEQAPWSRKMIGWLGEAEAKGKALGEALGEAKGKALGEAKGMARLLLRSLAKHGLRPTGAQEHVILSCTDDAQLEAWFDRTLTAKTVDDVLRQRPSDAAKPH